MFGTGTKKYVPVGNQFAYKWNGTCTQNRPFNLLIALILVANALLIGFQADLGLLLGGQRHWSSVSEDLHLFGYGDGTLAQMQQETDAAVAYSDSLEAEAKAEANGDSRRLAADRRLAHVDGAAYTLVEYIFVGLYTFELVVRFCDVGCSECICDWWIWLDTLCVFLGIADVSLPILLTISSVLMKSPSKVYKVMAYLRLSRVLRISRFFRVIPELRQLARPFFSALAIVLRIVVLIIIFNFCIAIITTAIIGQRASWWGDDSAKIDMWFGSIGRSMETLVLIMSLNGWANIANVIGEVYPAMIVVPCFVLYILLCTLAVFGIVTGRICDSFATRANDEEKEAEKARIEHRLKLEVNLKDKLSGEGEKEKLGYLNRKDFENLLYWEWYIMTDLQVLEPDLTKERLYDIFDALAQEDPDPENEGLVRYDLLAAAMANTGGYARAVDMVDVKNQCRSVRRESNQSAAALKNDIAERHSETMKMTKFVQDDQSKVQSCVRELQMTCTGLRAEFGSVKDRMKIIEETNVVGKEESGRTFATMQANCGELSTQVSACLKEQGEVFGEQIETVGKQADKAAADMVDMKKDVADLPQQVADATRRLQLQVRLIRKAYRRISLHNEVTYPPEPKIVPYDPKVAPKKEDDDEKSSQRSGGTATSQ